MEIDAGSEGSFGRLIRRRRVTAGLTQERLAELSGLSVRAISDIERGHAARPRRSTVELLECALAGQAPAGPAGPRDDGAAGRGLMAPRQLPPAVPHFVGRADELKALATLLKEPGSGTGSVATAVISGTAGVGKTALALHWAHEVAAQFADGQLYVNLRGFDPSRAPVSPADAVRGLLDALDVPPELIPRSADAQEGLYRSLLAGRRLLLVLDNARDADQVRPLLPASRTCMVVVTSRNQLHGLAAVDGARQICLDVLGYAEARELLRGRLSPGRLAGEPEAGDRLIALCAQLPLALSVAAARAAAHPAFPLIMLADELRDAGRRLDMLDGGDAASDVRAVFSWSIGHLDEPSIRMFRLLGVHPGPDISAAAAASLADLPTGPARRLLADLARANLLTEIAPGRYAFHDLLRAYAADLDGVPGSEAGRRPVIHRLLDHYLHSAHAADRLLYPFRRPISLEHPRPGVTPEDGLTTIGQALAWFDAEYRVLVLAIALAEEHGFDTHAWQLSWMLETFFSRRGHWHDWAATQHIALAAAERLADPYAEAEAHRGIASAQIELGQYDDALSHLTLALRLCQEIADVAGQARVHLDFARSLDDLGRSPEAASHAGKALRIYQAEGDKAKPTQADALNHMGWSLAHMGRYQQALEYCQQAVALHRQVGHKHSEPAALDSLAYVYSHLGHHADAADCYRQAAELYAKLGYHYREAETLACVGDAHHANGDTGGAREAWAQALTALDALRHADAGQVRAKLGQLG